MALGLDNRNVPPESCGLRAEKDVSDKISGKTIDNVEYNEGVRLDRSEKKGEHWASGGSQER